MVGVVVYDDLIVEILAKLPVKSLLRFHCVSKTWYSFISDPQFSNNLHRMRPSVLICTDLREFSTITVESLLRSKDITLTPTSLPWETKPNDCDSESTCLGSCNGLVCMSHRSSSCSTRDLIIWNPSTRKFRRLPHPRGYSVDRLPTFVWFGYDESIDDYKLVRLHLSVIKHPPKVAELDVFTLKSNTWRRSSVDHIAVGLSLHLFGPGNGGVLSNGAIHWININPSGTEIFILVLDLATEKLRVLTFPPHVPLNHDSRIGSLEGGCLCLCTDVYEDRFLLGRDFWIMKEYGVRSSWTKLLSIPLKLSPIKLSSPPPDYPILSSKEGKEMVVICTNGRRIVKLRVEEGWKNVRMEEIRLCHRRYPLRSNVILHMEESLVSISPTH